jgi:orotidine-5'-phosphate decarboxylase
MTFLSKLMGAQRNQNSLLCVGLDADTKLLPSNVRKAPNPALEFNKRIIEATHDLVCAYKLNLAFYEALGDLGWETMRQTLAMIPGNIITIGDGKRGDIGNTSAQYAKALFELGFDAVTVNPYMGFDSIEPFLKDSQRGAFILALTSNPGSKDFQRLRVGRVPLYEKVAATAKKWNKNKNVGLVVGATYPKELSRIRKIVPTMPLLIPGIGKQGGDLKSSIRFGCDKHGELALINASRSVIYASLGEDFAAAARREATKLRDEIRRYQEEFTFQR